MLRSWCRFRVTIVITYINEDLKQNGIITNGCDVTYLMQKWKKWTVSIGGKIWFEHFLWDCASWQWDVFRITGPLRGKPSVTGGSSWQRASNAKLNVICIGGLNKLLNNLSSCRWFDTPSCMQLTEIWDRAYTKCWVPPEMYVMDVSCERCRAHSVQIRHNLKRH